MASIRSQALCTPSSGTGIRSPRSPRPRRPPPHFVTRRAQGVVLLLALSGCTTYFVLRRSQPLVLQPAAEPPAPSEVEWRVPVGCDFSGFFVEVVLGFVPALARRRLLSPLRPGGHSRLHLLTGRCSSAFLAKLAPVEAAAYTSTWSDEAERSKGGRTAASIVIEHGHPCERRAWRADERPLWVVQRAMSEAPRSLVASPPSLPRRGVASHPLEARPAGQSLDRGRPLPARRRRGGPNPSALSQPLRPNPNLWTPGLGVGAL